MKIHLPRSEKPSSSSKASQIITISDDEDAPILVSRNLSQHDQSPRTTTFSSSANLCPICLDAFNTAGPHQLSCLPCGHLFGRSCLVTWLEKKKKCPVCLARSFQNQIRNLYVNEAGSIGAKAPCEKCHSLEGENHKLTDRLRELELQLAMMREEMGALPGGMQRVPSEHPALMDSFETPEQSTARSGAESDHLSAPPENSAPTRKRKRDAFQVPFKTTDAPATSMAPAQHSPHNITFIAAPHSESPLKKSKTYPHLAYTLLHSVNAKNARAMTPKGTTVYISTKMSKYAGFGIKLVSLSNINSSPELAVHDKMIRDLVVDPLSDVILTASDDHWMRISDMRDRKPVFNYDAHEIVRCCAWSKKHPNFLFGGLESGMLVVLDNRNNKRPLYTLQLNDTKQPIHALHYHQNFCSSGVGGLLAADNSGVSVVQETLEGYKRKSLMMGVASSVNYCAVSKRILATFRETEYTPACHRVFGLRPDLTPTKWDTIEGFTCGSFDSKNVLFSMEQRATNAGTDTDELPMNSSFVVSPDDSQRNQIKIWHVGTCDEVLSVTSKSSPIFSLSSVMKKRHLLALSRDHFQVFKNTTVME